MKKVNGWEKGTPQKLLNILNNGNVFGAGTNLIIKSMLAKSKGNVRVCTDMTGDNGVSIKKEKLCL